jgi:hypothetical protein
MKKELFLRIIHKVQEDLIYKTNWFFQFYITFPGIGYYDLCTYRKCNALLHGTKQSQSDSPFLQHSKVQNQTKQLKFVSSQPHLQLETQNYIHQNQKLILNSTIMTILRLFSVIKNINKFSIQWLYLSWTSRHN